MKVSKAQDHDKECTTQIKIKSCCWLQSVKRGHL